MNNPKEGGPKIFPAQQHYRVGGPKGHKNSIKVFLDAIKFMLQILVVPSPDPEASRSFLGFQVQTKASDLWPFITDALMNVIEVLQRKKMVTPFQQIYIF